MREKLRTSTREKVLFGLLAVVVAGSFMPNALAAIANVGSKWVSGEQVWYDDTTKATIFTIKDGTDGVVVATTLAATTIEGALEGAIGGATPAAGAFTTGTLAGLVLASDEYIGRFTYSADPNDTTATLTATNVLIGDFVIGGAQSGSANGTYKNLQGATPQNGSILLTFEVDPGAAVTYSFLVFR